MIEDQPPPTKAAGDIWLDVIKDMQERHELGMERYGTPLQAFNGRRALVDHYQELLDGLVYARQEIEERRRFAQRLDEAIAILSDAYFAPGQEQRMAGALSKIEAVARDLKR
jgi:hypothetical protein